MIRQVNCTKQGCAWHLSTSEALEDHPSMSSDLQIINGVRVRAVRRRCGEQCARGSCPFGSGCKTFQAFGEHFENVMLSYRAIVPPSESLNISHHKYCSASSGQDDKPLGILRSSSDDVISSHSLVVFWLPCIDF